MKPLFPNRGEEVYVSRSKRWHLSVNIARNGLLGLFLWMFHDQFITPSFQTIFDATGYVLPAALLVTSAFLGIWARYANRTTAARLSVLVGDVVFLAVFVGYLVALMNSEQQYGGWLPVIMGSMIGHDFVLISSSWLDPNDYPFKIENAD